MDVLFEAFETASSQTFEKKIPTNRNKCSRWWNPSCEAAVRELKTTISDEDRDLAVRNLKKVTKKAKREWADEYIQKAGVWDLAQWRHGRRLTKVNTQKRRGGSSRRSRRDG